MRNLIQIISKIKWIICLGLKDKEKEMPDLHLTISKERNHVGRQ